jgi:hypothetical protein
VPWEKFHGIHLHFSLKGLYCVVCRLHLRDELRLENRQAFANIWSDLVAGFTVLLLLVLNPKQVAIMRMTGDRLVTNVSDTGKAFIIILLSDIFLG